MEKWKDGDIDELLRKCARLPIPEPKCEPENRRADPVCVQISPLPSGQSSADLDPCLSMSSGRYRILAPIGEGGVGTVYKAEDTVLNRVVAMKVLSAAAMSDKIAVRRFVREAKSAARLRHPHIVSIYDFRKFRDIYFLVMQFIDGCPLSHLLQKQHPSADNACRIILDILDAAGYAHGQGIIHRDLKPGNVLLDREGQVFITDFGLAKALGEETKISRTGAVLGTPAYMSPEQARGEVLDVRSDVYAIGAILYEMLTGRPPIQGKSILELFYNLAHEEIADPTSIDPDISAPLANICNKALQKSREGRYRNTAEMAADILACRPNRHGLSRHERPRAGGNIHFAPAAVAILLATAFFWQFFFPQMPGEKKMSEDAIAQLPSDVPMAERPPVPMPDPIAIPPPTPVRDFEPGPVRPGIEDAQRERFLWRERERKKQIRGLWARMDADGNGHITREEWPGPKQAFARLDADRNGIVSRMEWDFLWPRQGQPRRRPAK